MPYRTRIWCAHPFHDKVLGNGKKRFSKVGPKPTHPKGKRIVGERLANFINSRHEKILNGSSKALEKGNYLCSYCFKKENELIMRQRTMEVNDFHINLTDHSMDSCSDDQENSPIDVMLQRTEQEDIKTKLNQVFALMNIEKIDDIRNTKRISNAVERACLKLRQWSNMFSPSSLRTEKPESFESLDLSIGDATWILYRVRELFNISDSTEQQRLMTILPTDWGRDRISNWFFGTRHQARNSIKLRTYSGVLSYPEDRRGNRPIDSQIELIVQRFYTSDEISRETSYKKQVIRPPPSKNPIPLRFLHLTVGETFQQFKLKYPDIELNRSKFFSLRPAWVREKTTHESCICIHHENADLLLKGVSKSIQCLVTIKSLVEKTVCSCPTEDCYFRRCFNCRHVKASDVLSEGIDLEIQDSATWSMWKKLNSRYELLHLTGTIEALLEEIDNFWPNFITHSYYTHEQRDYIIFLKGQSSITSYAVVQLDFAQNFSLITQREIQSAYYCRQQATILTVYIKIGEEHRNMVFISDYLAHDTRCVYCAQKVIAAFLKKEYRNVSKVVYVSDGASAHFKNKYSMYNLANHYADYNIQASWVFSAAGHGKSPCDGIGAVIKSTATRHLLKGGPSASFSSPKDFFDWCFTKNDRMVITRPSWTLTSQATTAYIPEPSRPIEVRWLSADEINKVYNNVLMPRWKCLTAKDSIVGIRDIHHFDSNTDGSLSCRRTSQSSKVTTHVFRAQPATQSQLPQDFSEEE